MSVPSVLCRSAATPAVAGDAILVPLIVRPVVVTEVPFAVISGSSRSSWLVVGFRKTEDDDIAEAESSWFATARLL